MSTITLSPATRLRRSGWFLRHFAEMTLAMLVGMVGYAVIVGGLLSAAGSSLEAARLDQPELFPIGMASGMTVPMVAWMRRRGHSWRSGAEMSAAMFVPALALIGCYWLHAVEAGSICPIACAAMIPAMIVAMVYRLDEYTGDRHSAAVAA